MKPKLKAGLLLSALLVLPAWAGNSEGRNDYRAGVAAYNHGDYRHAGQLFERAAENAPNNVDALYYDAICQYKLNNLAAALALYKEIVRMSPNSVAGKDARVALAEMQASAGSEPSLPAATVSSQTVAVNTISPNAAGNQNTNDFDSLPNTASFYFTREPGGHMCVDLMVNNHPVKAWFDTGASAFFYKDQLVESGVDCDGATPGGNATGWNGKPVPVLVMPANIQLGTFARTITICMQDVTADLGHNLVGQDLIKGYQYSIDEKGKRVDLTKTESLGVQQFDPLYDVPCVSERGKDTVQIEINGTKVPAFIDTGATYSMLDPAAAQTVGIQFTGGSETLGGVGGQFQVSLGSGNVRLGPVFKQNFLFRVGGTAGTCIGQDFMQNWRCEVDRQHGLLRFFH